MGKGECACKYCVITDGGCFSCGVFEFCLEDPPGPIDNNEDCDHKNGHLTAETR